MSAPSQRVDGAFRGLLDAWVEAREKRNPYSSQKINHFFNILGRRLVVFALWSRADLTAAAVEMLLDRFQKEEVLSVPTLIEVVSIISKRSHLHSFAGKLALRVRSLIDTENDVGSRTAFYGRLARAILPASRDEAAAYSEQVSNRWMPSVPVTINSQTQTFGFCFISERR